MTPTVTFAIKKQKPLSKKKGGLPCYFLVQLYPPKRKLTCQMVQSTTMNEDIFPIEHGEKISILVILVNSGVFFSKKTRGQRCCR